MRDPIDPPPPVPLPSEAELAEARDAIDHALKQARQGQQQPPRSPEPTPETPPEIRAPGMRPSEPPPANPARIRTRVNWTLAAELLARGLDVEAAANQLGCSAQVIRRNLRRSPRFRRRIEAAHEELRLSAQLRFLALGDHAVRHLQRADKLDVRILQWLGGMVGLGSLRARPAGELSARFETVQGGKSK